MSHYTTIEVKLSIHDIEAIRDACAELKLKIRAGGIVRYYFSHNQQHADYVVSIPGCPYDVGLVKDGNGNFKLVYDDYQGYVEKALGKGCHKLIQSAIFHKIRRKSVSMGKHIFKQQKSGSNSLFVEITI